MEQCALKHDATANMGLQKYKSNCSGWRADSSPGFKFMRGKYVSSVDLFKLNFNSPVQQLLQICHMCNNFNSSRIPAHNHIVGFHGICICSDKLWLVMELAPCGSLYKVTNLSLQQGGVIQHFRILKRTLNCGSGIFLKVQFQKTGDFGPAHSWQNFHF